jgi:hypothetical protein
MSTSIIAQLLSMTPSICMCVNIISRIKISPKSPIFLPFFHRSRATQGRKSGNPFVWALALNGPYFVVDIVACDSHERRNFCSPINQIFHKAPMESSTIQTSMSNDCLCMRFDHRLSHLYACIAKLLILAFFVKIIHMLAAIFLG